MKIDNPLGGNKNPNTTRLSSNTKPNTKWKIWQSFRWPNKVKSYNPNHPQQTMKIYKNLTTFSGMFIILSNPRMKKIQQVIGNYDF